VVSDSGRSRMCSQVKRDGSLRRRTAPSTDCRMCAITAAPEVGFRSAGSNRQRAAHPVAPAGGRGRRRGRATGRDTTGSRRSGRGAGYLDLGSDQYDHVLRRRAHQRRRSSRPEVRSGLLAEANVVRGEVTYGPVVRGQDFPLTVPARALESLALAYHPDLEMVNRKRDTAIGADAGRAVAGGEMAVRP